MGKKWYNYFVETTQADARPALNQDAPQPDVPAAAPRAADLVKDTDEDAPLPAATGTPADIEAVYDAAQISVPAHGYSVLKVSEMLQSEHMRGLPPDVKKRSILVALDAAGVQIVDVVEDAVRRDRALDTYERVLQKNLEDLRAQKERENARLEEEINTQVAELRRRMVQNRAEIDKEQRDLDAWRVRKGQEESRIAEAVGYFVSANPITTATVPGKDK